MESRWYQDKIINEIYAEWNAGKQNVLAQLATGGGKTFIFAKILKDNPGYGIAIAHRVELISQISLALARQGVRHALITNPAAIREIVAIHMDEVGRSFYDPNGRVIVAGVDTVIKRTYPWYSKITLVVQDEGHHPLRDNKWGKAAALFPNARGLYPTATPVRADGRGLGRSSDGIMDAMVVGIPMAELIKAGYLTPYRIFAPQCDIDLLNVPVAAGGDYSPKPLREAVHRSHITGDVVGHYLKIAPGKLGVTFAVDIESATEIAAEFRSRGVSAEVVSSKTPDLLRSNIMRRFRDRQILQLVNVDLLGEGVDVPALEVVSMARPTQSYGLYSQQFGRALRPLPGKSHAIIIDHVGNVMRHGLPDVPRTWSLDRRERRGRSVALDVEPIRTCFECISVYSRFLKACPYCGHIPIPAGRSIPQQVDGDLFELDDEALAKLRGEIDRIDGSPKVPRHLDAVAQRAVSNRHAERQNVQTDLRECIAQWAGFLKADKMDDPEIYKRFYFAFGVDIMTAQTLNVQEALKLSEKIRSAIDDFVNRN
jgi:DNA repair protein RadD